MPNLVRANASILQSPLDFQERAFWFMFELDENGKCQVRHSDAAWDAYKENVRRYWKDMLRVVLKEHGSLDDYRTAGKVFKLDLRELLSEPPVSQ